MQLRYPLLPGYCRWLLFMLGLCCLSCSGGGPKLNPVKGTLLYHNKPLPDATVSFHRLDAGHFDPPSTGLTDEDGSFTLVTGDREGAPAGEYKVTVACVEEAQPKGKAKTKKFSLDNPAFTDRLKGAYVSVDRSKISVQIKNGTNRLDPINLE
jgi:hypothetical protein